MGDEPFHLPDGFRFGVATAGFQVDSMGDDSAGAYRRLIEGLRAGDRSVVDP